jgi:hypothetical protein
MYASSSSSSISKLDKFVDNITTNKSQVAKPGTEMEIYFSFPVADPDILKI